MTTDTALERLREICLALPEATETPFGGHTAPTWRIRDKIFAMSGGVDYDGGELSLWCKALPGAQEVLVSGDPGRFFVPPYVGHNGWIGIRLDRPADWEMVAALVTDSYRMTAPKRLVAQLDAAAQALVKGGSMPENSPNGSQRIVPMIAYEEAAGAIDWLIRAFGFRELTRMTDEDGRIGHAELELDGGIVYLASSPPDYEGPRRHREACEPARKWSNVPWVIDGVMVQVDDANAHYRQAKEAGATILSEPEDQPYGCVYRAEDLEGHRWMFMQPRAE